MLDFLGYTQFAGKYYFALRDEHGALTWTPIGGSISTHVVKSFDPDTGVLTVEEPQTGKQTTLVLAPGKVHEGSVSTPLSHDEALQAVKRLIALPLTDKPNQLRLQDLPPDLRMKIQDAGRNYAVSPPATSFDKTDPRSTRAVQDSLRNSNLEVLDEENSGGPYRVDAFRPLRLDELPKFIAANLTQKDLDSFLELQIKAASAAAENAKAALSSSNGNR